MPKKGENIYKRKDGRWEGRYISSYDIAGKAKYGYVYGKTYSGVKSVLIRKKANAASQPVCPVPQTLTYTELLDAWLRVTGLKTKPSTYARYTQLVNAHIRPYIGAFLTSQISTRQIEDMVEHLLSAGRLDGKGGLSPKTVRDVISVIKCTLEYAVRQHIPVNCSTQALTVKAEEKEMRVLTSEEQNSLVAVLTTQMDLSKFGVLLSLYTGIRIGELCALQWGDFSEDASILRVRRTLQRIQAPDATAKTKIIITAPKSLCSVREIPLPAFLAQLARSFQGEAEAFVLSGSAHRYVEPRTMQNRFRAYIKQSGIAAANYHALRHSFATRCVELSFDIKTLSVILGHSSVNTTLNRYVHSSMDLKKANMDKLSLYV